MPRQPGRHIDSAAAVGRRLRDARTRAGLSQRDLAFDGCTNAYISRIESGARIPSMQILQEFGRRLGVTAEFLARGTEQSADLDPLLDAELSARLGDDEDAQRQFEQVLRHGPGDRRTRARALAGLGDLALRRGNHAEAIAHFEQALTTDRLPADIESAVADRLGRAYAIACDYTSAIALYERQLTLAQDRADELALMRFAILLANVVADGGNYGRAQELLGHALTIAEKTTDPLDRARLWWSQSRLHTLRGDRELASRYARLALDTLEATEHSGYAAVAYQLLAQVENERGNAADALDFLERGYAAVVASGNRYYDALFRVERARALVVLGEHEEAAALAMSAAPLLESASPIDAGRGYAVIAGVFATTGDRPRAIELYELAAERLPVADRYRATALTSLAELLEAEGRPAEALAVLKRALQPAHSAHTT